MIALCNVTSCINDIDAVDPGKPVLYIVLSICSLVIVVENLCVTMEILSIVVRNQGNGCYFLYLIISALSFIYSLIENSFIFSRLTMALIPRDRDMEVIERQKKSIISYLEWSDALSLSIMGQLILINIVIKKTDSFVRSSIAILCIVVNGVLIQLVYLYVGPVAITAVWLILLLSMLPPYRDKKVAFLRFLSGMVLILEFIAILNAMLFLINDSIFLHSNPNSCGISVTLKHILSGIIPYTVPSFLISIPHVHFQMVSFIAYCRQYFYVDMEVFPLVSTRLYNKTLPKKCRFR